MDSQVCVFAGVKEEVPKTKGEQMYTCIHGKTLSWATARRMLGLKTSEEKGN